MRQTSLQIRLELRATQAEGDLPRICADMRHTHGAQPEADGRTAVRAWHCPARAAENAGSATIVHQHECDLGVSEELQQPLDR